MVELFDKFNVPTVSEKPAPVPVLNVPPFSTIFIASFNILFAPNLNVPAEIVKLPVNVEAADKV